MIEENKKLDENKLAELFYDDILYSLEKINKNINDEFKYDRVILSEALKENFSFEKMFELLQEKRKGNYRVFERELGFHLLCDFKKA